MKYKGRDSGVWLETYGAALEDRRAPKSEGARRFNNDMLMDRAIWPDPTTDFIRLQGSKTWQDMAPWERDHEYSRAASLRLYYESQQSAAWDVKGRHMDRYGIVQPSIYSAKNPPIDWYNVRVDVQRERNNRMPLTASSSLVSATSKVKERVAIKPVIVDVTKGGQIRGGYMPVSPFKSQSRGGNAIGGVVFHHTGSNDLMSGMSAGLVAGSKQYRTGAHYFIDRDGTIYQYLPDTTRIANIREPKSPLRVDKEQPTAVLGNANTIGVEIVATGSDSITREQLEAATKLGAFLATEYNLPPSMIVGHGQLQGGPHGNKQADEGVNVAALVRQSLMGATPPSGVIAANWGQVWAAPAGGIEVAQNAPIPRNSANVRVAEWAQRARLANTGMTPALQAIMDSLHGVEPDAPELAYAEPIVVPAEENAVGGFDLRNTAIYGVRLPPEYPRPILIPDMTDGIDVGKVIDAHVLAIARDPAIAIIRGDVSPTGVVAPFPHDRPIVSDSEALPVPKPLEPSKSLVDREGGPWSGYNTILTKEGEAAYQAWKAKYAPNDSGVDYDLRGAFAAGVTPSANGHFPDTFKKPNHPTFSVESRYAKFRPFDAGYWNGDTFIPPQRIADVGREPPMIGVAPRPKLADVGREPPAILDFTNRPRPADGVVTVPRGDTVNGRPVVEVAGDTAPPARASIFTAPRVTAPIIFSPTVPGADTRDWSVTLPKTMSEALAVTNLASLGNGLDSYIAAPKVKAIVDVGVEPPRVTDVVKPAPIDDTTVGKPPTTKTVPTVPIRVTVTSPGITPRQKQAINDVSMIQKPLEVQGPPVHVVDGPNIYPKIQDRLPPDNGLFITENVPLPRPRPTPVAPARPVTTWVDNPAYLAWKEKYGNGLANMSGSPDDRDERRNAPIVVPPAPPRTIQQVVTPRPRPPDRIDTSGGNYTVQSGDTLSALSRRYGVSVAEIARANGIRDVNTIWSGQRLTIPTANNNSSAVTVQEKGAPTPAPKGNGGPTSPAGPVYVSKGTGDRLTPVTKSVYNPDTGNFEPRTVYVKAG